MKSTLNILNKIIDAVGYICMIALLLMILNVFLDVFIRYVVFGIMQKFQLIDALDWWQENLSWLGGIGMQELEWHWFSVMFMLGLGYTLRDNAHVRVDVLYDNFSRKTQACINIFGALVFAIPFSCLVVYFGIEFFMEAWETNENLGDPGSLPRIWPAKLLVPVSFGFLVLSAIAVILQEAIVLAEYREEAH